MGPENSFGVINREVVGRPIDAYGHRVQPVAQVSGWQSVWPPNGTESQGMGGGAFLRAYPAAIRVAHADQTLEEIEIVDPTTVPLRGMLWASIVIATVAVIVNWVIEQKYG